MRFSDSIFKRGEAKPPRKEMEGENRIKTIPAKPVEFFTKKTICQSCEEFVPSALAMYRTLLAVAQRKCWLIDNYFKEYKHVKTAEPHASNVRYIAFSMSFNENKLCTHTYNKC